MLINISSGFFHSRPKKILAIFFFIFQLCTWKITVSALTSVNFHGSFWNVAGIFIASKISEEFDYGGSALLNMRIMDHLMSRPLLAFLDSLFKLVTKFGIKVGLKMLININSWFFHNRQKKINCWFFFAFCNFAHGKSPLALSHP